MEIEYRTDQLLHRFFSTVLFDDHVLQQAMSRNIERVARTFSSCFIANILFFKGSDSFVTACTLPNPWTIMIHRKLAPSRKEGG